MRHLAAICLIALLIVVAGADARLAFGRAEGTPAGDAPPATPPAATPAPDTLDERTVEELVIFGFAPEEEPEPVPVGTLDATAQVMPGESVRLTLGVYQCCYFFHPVAARVVWSVAPAAEGADIDAGSGLLTIEPDVPSGSIFTVRADVEEGRRTVTAEVHIFTPETNPLVGYWREAGQLACGTGAEISPAEPIRELVFNADGTFTVTWVPFEIYVDYWGAYTFDEAAGTIELEVEGGNYVPPDIDGSGRFSLNEAGNLVLTELWLGSPSGGTGSANCGHRFA